MPDAAGTKNDGGMAFGSQVVTIGGATYIAEAFTLTRGSTWAESANENGVPNKQFGRQTIPTGSLTLQLVATTTAAPALFAEFDAIPTGESGAVTLIISEVGQVQGNDQEHKVNISVRKKLN